MRSATELREPFLDHRLLELAFRQPLSRKIADGVHKKMLREIVKKIVPANVVEAPKRPLQTPQREWLRGDLRGWANELIEGAITNFGGAWLDEKAVRQCWKNYCAGASDNSFYVWQWISLSLARQSSPKISGGNEFERKYCNQSGKFEQEISYR